MYIVVNVICTGDKNHEINLLQDCCNVFNLQLLFHNCDVLVVRYIPTSKGEEVDNYVIEFYFLHIQPCVFAFYVLNLAFMIV